MKRKKAVKEPDNAPAGEKIISDPQGMYTGRPEERYEVPVQDADDL